MFDSKRSTQSVPITATVLVMSSPLLIRTCVAFAVTPSIPAACTSHKFYTQHTGIYTPSKTSRWMTSKNNPHTEITAAIVNLEEKMEDDDDDDDDDENARSQFGTRQYWDDVYLGQGDFPAEEYSWYFGWEILEKYVQEFIPSKTIVGDNPHILCPGVGNDSILVDLYRSKYPRITAFDYSEHAIERQQDLINFELPAKAMDNIELHAMDARKLPNPDWNVRFDAIIEKGALDAIYLSGDGNVERAVENLHRVLKPGGIMLSVSGVVPEDLRNELFRKEDWEWLRDGSDELQAGCFILRKPLEPNNEA